MPGTRKRDRIVSAWFTQEEHCAFRARCEEDGERVSCVVRTLAANYVAGRDVSPTIDRQLGALQEEIRRLGVNLNQLLHLAHTEALQGGAAELRGFAGVTALLVRAVGRLLQDLEPYRNKRRAR